MENYQTATVVVGIISFTFWIIVGFLFWPALFLGFVSLIFLFTCFADTKHCHTLGAMYIVVGILFNFLYLIPGIMALRWKPKLLPPVQTVYEIQPRVATQEEQRIAELEKRIADLEKEKLR